MWKVTPILLSVLLNGCAQSGDYCDVAAPMYFDSTKTIEWLNENDGLLLQDIVVHNEQHQEFC